MVVDLQDNKDKMEIAERKVHEDQVDLAVLEGIPDRQDRLVLVGQLEIAGTQELKEFVDHLDLRACKE